MEGVDDKNYIESKRNIFDDEGICPICMEKVEASMTLVCCFTQICTPCFFVFNRDKSEYKCYNCNSSVYNKLDEYIIDKKYKELISQYRDGEINSIDFLEKIGTNLNKNILEKVSVKRLLECEDCILVDILPKKYWNKYDYMVLDFLKPHIKWDSKIKLNGNYTSIIHAYIRYKYDSFIDEIILSMTDFNDYYAGESFFKSILYWHYKSGSRINQEVILHIVKNIPIEEYSCMHIWYNKEVQLKETVLHRLIRCGAISAAEYILPHITTKNLFNINAEYESTLCLAIMQGAFNIVKYILEHPK
jgi:hypothetical protein